MTGFSRCLISTHQISRALPRLYQTGCHRPDAASSPCDIYTPPHGAWISTMQYSDPIFRYLLVTAALMHSSSHPDLRTTFSRWRTQPPSSRIRASRQGELFPRQRSATSSPV
ncbi:unnamed protein product [Periconia digitata]|uniref:Uncharacterized protein n=1 Tax=Periconia digitata TaxID=1303443 RepID=A0A9W4XV95_9PLEO|nr:unnamed protein product [Periconia digitata]